MIAKNRFPTFSHPALGAANLRRLPFLKDALALNAILATIAHQFLRGLMSVETLYSLFSLALGFGLAGLIASTYQLVTERALSFRLLNGVPCAATLAAVPMLVFAAPFIIMRNTIRGRRIERRQFQFTMAATMLAGLWSLMSGTAAAMALTALGLLLA